MANDLKRCTKCGETKALTEFHRHPQAKDRRQSRCRACMSEDRKASYPLVAETEKKRAREWRKKNIGRAIANSKNWIANNPDKWAAIQRRSWLKRYDITPEQWDAMFARQGGRCAICSTAAPGGVANRLHVDHDHDTGEVRGLLCHSCNKGIGHLGDDAERVYAAAIYLRDKHWRTRAA